MATYFNEQVDVLVKELVLNITRLEETTETFKQTETRIKKRLLRADSMSFLNRDDVDRSVSSLADKFVFHGFCAKADQLVKAYEKYMATSKIEPVARLNVVRFLMGVARSQTERFAVTGDDDDEAEEDEGEIRDWGAYLREGVERWCPESDGESSEWTDDDSRRTSPTPDTTTNKTVFIKCSDALINASSDLTLTSATDNFQTIKSRLLGSVQNTWFTSDHVREVPESDWLEANTVVKWEHHLEELVHELIPIAKASIISEYKVMREVLWQLWGQHDSFVFKLAKNGLVLNPKVTVCSVRLEAFQDYMQVFIPHFELLDYFRGFCEQMNDTATPDTYRSYSYGVSNILSVVKLRLVELERKVAKQEDSMTLLKLEREIRDALKPLRILKQIHKKVIVDRSENTALFCATNLLMKLHENLLHSYSKLQQDLCLTLYLESVYTYCKITENWLTQDNFQDRFDEFPIVNNNSRDFVGCVYKSVLENLNNTTVLNTSATDQGQQDWQMEFVEREVGEEARRDGFIKTICERVLSVGKNVHLLHLLGKLHLANETTEGSYVTLHEEFRSLILEEVRKHFGSEKEGTKPEENEASSRPKHPLICPDRLVKITDWDRLENLVDVEDGFLMRAFAPFLTEQNPSAEKPEKLSLFEEISQTTKSLFPAQNIVEKVFRAILKRRFDASGRILKGLLYTENHLERHLEFLTRVYLFKDDFVFTFYQRLFRQFTFAHPPENYTRLTSYFRDQIMDAYPDFCDSCTVKTGEEWSSCRDPLTALGLVNVHFTVLWPLNIIIRTEHLEMYCELFEFNVKIKWALHTLGHLYFGQMPKSKIKALRLLLRRLQVLRFKLLHVFGTIQRYVFGYVYPTNLRSFEVALDRASDVDSMINAHGDFISTIHKSCMELKDYRSATHGFDKLLRLVHEMALMWKNQHHITDEELDSMDRSYEECAKSIDDFVVPTYYVL